MMKLLPVLFPLFILTACSDGSTDKVDKDHVWKDQTDMIDKAKGVESLLNDAADLQKQKIEEQTH
jgi:hypothetical protein